MAEVEKTFALIKPDAVRKGKAGEIMQLIELNGFTIIAKQKMQLTVPRAEEFYGEHKGKEFFPKLVAFMTSGPIWALVLAKPGAILGWRELMGPTNVFKAREEKPKCLRALYGTDGTQNATHGSDSPASAAREIKFFFPSLQLDPASDITSAAEYITSKLQPALAKALTALARDKPSADKYEAITFLANYLLANNPNKPRIIMPDQWDPSMEADDDDEAEFANAKLIKPGEGGEDGMDYNALMASAVGSSAPPVAAPTLMEDEGELPPRPAGSRPMSAVPVPPPGKPPSRPPSALPLGGLDAMMGGEPPAPSSRPGSRPPSSRMPEPPAAEMPSSRQGSRPPSARMPEPPADTYGMSAEMEPEPMGSRQASRPTSARPTSARPMSGRPGSRPGSAASAAAAPPPMPERSEPSVGTLEGAATKVQAAFRGYQARKEVALMRAVGGDDEEGEPRQEGSGLDLDDVAAMKMAMHQRAEEAQEELAERAAEAEASQPQQEGSGMDMDDVAALKMAMHQRAEMAQEELAERAAEEAEEQQARQEGSGLDLDDVAAMKMAMHQRAEEAQEELAEREAQPEASQAGQEGDEEYDMAATRVQAHIRGHLARKKVAELKAQRAAMEAGEPSTSEAAPPPEDSYAAAGAEGDEEPQGQEDEQQELAAGGLASMLPEGVTEEEAVQAAMLVQAHMRGHLARKQVAQLKAERVAMGVGMGGEASSSMPPPEGSYAAEGEGQAGQEVSYGEQGAGEVSYGEQGPSEGEPPAAEGTYGEGGMPEGEGQGEPGFGGSGMPEGEGEGEPGFGESGMPEGEGEPEFGQSGMPEGEGEGEPGFGESGMPEGEGEPGFGESGMPEGEGEYGGSGGIPEGEYEGEGGPGDE